MEEKTHCTERETTAACYTPGAADAAVAPPKKEAAKKHICDKHSPGYSVAREIKGFKKGRIVKLR